MRFGFVPAVDRGEYILINEGNVMARVTVEDCLNNVSNRFELVLLASKRARQIAKEGKEPLVPIENDKPTVLALREIADDLVDTSLLEDNSSEPKSEPITEAEITEVAKEQAELTEEGTVE